MDATTSSVSSTDSPRTIQSYLRLALAASSPGLNLRLARAGVGLTMTDAPDTVLGSGMVKVLEKFTKPYPGLYLHYSQRRHVSPALRALIDYLRRKRNKRPSRDA